MNKWITKGAGIILFIAVFNTLEHYCHKKTDGFSLGRIQFTDEPIQTFQENFPAALNQPFHYLDCGNQCFAFLSEDGQYVLKFFKYVHKTTPDWIGKVPLLNRLKPFRPHRLKKIDWKRERDFSGYRIAYEHLRQETGLLALHLQPSENHFPITLYDKLNIRHTFDLNRAPFILQKKAIPVYTQFSTWIKNGELDKARTGIKQLVDLCHSKLAQNIYDDDVHFYSNFGFVGEQPVQVDPGHFMIHPVLDKQREIATLTLELKQWFSKHYPPLAPYVEECTISP